MTLSVKISVNGNYKTTYTVNGGGPIEISGAGHDGPNAVDVTFQHGQPLDLHIEPDQPVEQASMSAGDVAGQTEDNSADEADEADEDDEE